MNRSCRVFITTIPLLAVLAACGSVTGTSTTGQPTTPGAATQSTPGAAVSSGSIAGRPPVIHLGGRSPSGEASAAPLAGEAVDSKMRVAPGSIIYSFSGEPPALATTGPSWSMPAKQDLDSARVVALAAAFGLTGPVVRLPADQGGGWQVGEQDGTTANLTVVDDGQLSWYFNPVMGSNGQTVACAEASPPEGAALSVPVAECPQPTPPAGVPTKEEALAKAKALFTAAGVDLTGQTLDATADEWSASATATLYLGGHRTQLTTQVFFGGAGAVTAASGFLSTPVAGADYPLVGIAQAVKRLNDRDGAWMTPLGDASVAVRGSAAGVAAPPPALPNCAPLVDAVDAVGAAEPNSSATLDPATSAGGTAAVAVAPVPDEQLLCPQTQVGSGATPVAPDVSATTGADAGAPASTIAPIVITLTGVRLDIDPVFASDGTVWLLPTYAFTSADGGEFDVLAVADDYLHNDGA